MLEDVRQRYGIPAIAAAAVRSDTVLSTEIVGIRRLGYPTPVSARDRFHLGSNTKALTAVLLATLVEEGQLEWSTRPVDVLPGLSDSIHAAYRDITLEQLLSHRAGVPAYTSGFAIALLPDSVYQPGTRSSLEWRHAFALHVLRNTPKLSPGTGFLYSNAGYTVAAAMAEAVTGQPWEILLESRLFRPLDLAGGYGWPASADSAQPWGHRRTLFRGLQAHDPNGSYQLGALLAPAGDVHISIEDYATFLQQHLRGLQGRDGVLRAATVQRLHAPTGNYALGWIIKSSGGASMSAHEGNAGTFHTIAILHPEHDLAVAVFASAGSRKAVNAARQLADVLFELYRD